MQEKKVNHHTLDTGRYHAASKRRTLRQRPRGIQGVVVKNLIMRAKILQEIRVWFIKNQFVEVETPILVDSPDLSLNLNILTTEIHSEIASPKSATEINSNAAQTRFISSQPCINSQKKFLITSPEFSMKKLLAQDGLDNIFTITKVFRDGEGDTGIHNIEFTMLEWYRKGADYNQIMQDTEELIFFTSSVIIGTGSVETGLKPVSTAATESYATPFPRLKISILFKKHAHIENVEKLTLSELKKIIYSRGYSKDKNLTYEQCFNLIFLNEIEAKLPKTPFFLIDYPAPLACLAKLKKNNPFIAERFELYINGIELCNGFSELTDGKEQLKRFKMEIAERKKMEKQVFPIDYELCKKLDSIGRAGGNALGIDRLIMILLRIEKIDEIMVNF